MDGRFALQHGVCLKGIKPLQMMRDFRQACILTAHDMGDFAAKPAVAQDGIHFLVPEKQT